MKSRVRYRSDLYNLLYSEGASIYEIGELVGRDPLSIGSLLTHFGYRKAPRGKDIEIRVRDWFRRQGARAELMPGGHAYDILAGGDRIDVKSAIRVQDVGRGSWSYKFQLQDRRRRLTHKAYKDFFDYFLLVFKDIEGMPMYRINPEDVGEKVALSVASPSTTKHPIIFVGFLGNN